MNGKRKVQTSNEVREIKLRTLNPHSPSLTLVPCCAGYLRASVCWGKANACTSTKNFALRSLRTHQHVCRTAHAALTFIPSHPFCYPLSGVGGREDGGKAGGRGSHVGARRIPLPLPFLQRVRVQCLEPQCHVEPHAHMHTCPRGRVAGCEERLRV